MYARVTTTQVQPGRLAGMSAIWREGVLPAARQQPGFKGVLVLANRHTNQGVSLTLWETEADLQASRASGYVREALAKFTGVFVGPLIQDTYAVVYHTETLLTGRRESRYAGVVSLQLQPGPDKADEAMEVWRRTALAQVRQSPGFHDLLLLLDRERDRALSIALYESEAAAQAFETRGSFQQVVALLRDLFVQQPVRTVYEVRLQAYADHAGTAPAAGAERGVPRDATTGGA